MTGVRLLGLPVVLVAALVAPACGSAEVRSSTPPEPTAAAPAEGPASTGETGCTGTAPEPTNADWEQQVIELVNQQRKANGLPPLKHVTSLTDAARWYAKDMVDDDYFGPGHDTYDRVGGRLIEVCAWSARIGAFYAGGERSRREHRGGLFLAAGGGHRLDGQLRAPRQHPERELLGDRRRVQGGRARMDTVGYRTSAAGGGSIPS